MPQSIKSTIVLTPRQKALQINLNTTIYGSFSEIGAGQETVRYFFRAGGASGTIAKAMSAYDKDVSDAIYGENSRYVSQERLKRMLDHEIELLEDRIKFKKKNNRRFFSYANTVTTIDFKKKNKGHGWVGVRFQLDPEGTYNEIILHVRFLENETRLQQETLGILGVNLIYGAFNYTNDTKLLINTLYDELNKDQFEVDMINFEGDCFKDVDNRLMSLELVKLGMASAVVFGPNGKNILPSDELYKKNIFAVRGSFRPVTNVNIDMFNKGLEMFFREKGVKENNTNVLFEITLSNLINTGGLEGQDFLDRADTLGKLGYNVLISNFSEYYKLVEYFNRFTKNRIGIALGVNNLEKVFDESFYEKLGGGMLEAFGKLFTRNSRLYSYPFLDPKTGELLNTDNLKISYESKELYNFFKNNKFIVDIRDYNPDFLQIYGDQIRESLTKNDKWEKDVPNEIVEMIKSNKMFGFLGEK